MSVLIVCPGCQKKVKIDDKMLGKRIKCPSCEAVFPAKASAGSTPAAPPPTPKKDKPSPNVAAPDDEDDRPRKRKAQATRAADDDGGRRGKSSGAKKSSVGLIVALIGGGLALLLIVGGGGAVGVYFLYPRGGVQATLPREGTPTVKVPSKPAVPALADQSAAEKEIKDLYKADYAKREAVEMKAFAGRLLQEGIDTKNKPAHQFVLLREARDLAIQGGDLTLALRAADQLGERFDVDAFEMKAGLLETATQPGAAATLAPPDAASLALALADEAAETDHYAAAERLAKVAQASSADLVQPVAIAALERVREVTELRKAFDAIRDAVRTLNDKPDDPAANYALGRFHALNRGDWDRGLAYLAQGSDAQLKAIALADLANPADANAAAKLADDYAGRATTETGTAKTSLLGRALYWYGQAVNSLSGFERSKMEKKWAEVDATLPPQRPVVVRALYGSQGTWADVTERVRALVVQPANQTLTIEVQTPALGIDPTPNQKKTLVVVSRRRSTLYLSTPGETETLTLPEPSAVPQAFLGKQRSDRELPLLFVRLGAEGTWADATERFRSLLNGKSLRVQPLQVGIRDPFPGKNKACIIVYREAGTVRLSITAAEATVRLGADAQRP